MSSSPAQQPVNLATNLARPRVGQKPVGSRKPSLERLYRDHAGFVWRTVKRLGIPEASAEDVVHYVDQVVQSGESLDVQVDATAFTWFELRLGTNVTADECNDVFGNGVVIDTVWEPVSGTVDVHLEPDGELARATVTLTDVTLQVTQGIAAEAHISSYVFDDVQVGWLPG